MKRITAFFMALILIVFASSCDLDNKNTESDTIKVYFSNAMSDGTYIINNMNELFFMDLIDNYNETYKNDDGFKKIEVVEFENEEAMRSKLSTELMAGTGPDIIFSSASLPYEKLISMGVLADIDEILKFTDIDTDNYNKIVFDSGCVKGKRYFLPLFYSVDTISALNSKLENYKISKDSTFTYDNLNVVCNQYLQKSDIPFYLEYADRKELICDIVSEYVDFDNKSCDFDNNMLKSALNTAYELMNAGLTDVEETAEDSLFSKYCGDLGFLGACAYFASALKSEDEVVIFNDISENAADIKATVQLGVAVNNASTQKKDIAYFLDYLLSQKVQNDFCGANIKEYNEAYIMGSYLPVNNLSLNDLLKTGVSLTYCDNTVNIKNDDIEPYVSYITKINKCDMGIYNYYKEEIIGDPVSDFLDGSINTNKFIEQLTAKTKLYLEE